MQQERNEISMTLEDLCSFDLFPNNHITINKEKEEGNISNEDNHIPEEPEEDDEVEDEEEVKATNQMRKFPNVAYSRFAFTKLDETNSPKQNIYKSNYQHKTITENKKSPLNTYPNDHCKFTQSLGHFNQHYNYPQMQTVSTQHSSIANSSYPQDNFHKSMPIQPYYVPYLSQYPQIPNCSSNRCSAPLQAGLSNSINFYYPQLNSLNVNCPMAIHNSLTYPNDLTKTNQQKGLSSPSSFTVEDYDTLDELLSSLKGGKQIGNYIKSRNNSDAMINLIKKLPSNKIGELIDLINHKMKEIMISNNKFSQKLFEKCTSEHRVVILNSIKDSFIEIALNKWGSYSLQALIKNVSLPEEQDIIKKCIEGKVYELAMDKQANFVLQKLILLLSEKGMTSITDEILSIFNHLIYNSTGIGLLKNLVLTNKGSETRKKFVLKVIENLGNIINNPTGYSLLLQMMEKWDFETCKPMITEIIKDINKYSQMKNSAIVIVKVINISDVKIVKTAYTTLLKSDSLLQLSKIDYGKEIIREIFKRFSKKQKAELSIPEFIQELI